MCYYNISAEPESRVVAFVGRLLYYNLQNINITGWELRAEKQLAAVDAEINPIRRAYWICRQKIRTRRLLEGTVPPQPCLVLCYSEHLTNPLIPPSIWRSQTKF